MSEKCIIEGCHRREAQRYRGLCLPCYNKAKKLIEACKTTWEELERLGLASEELSNDPFLKSFNKAKEGEGEATFP